MLPDGVPYRFLARRLAWAVSVVLVALTACFLIIWSLPESRAVGFGTVAMGFAAVGADKGGIVATYVAWMWSFLTLDWGTAFVYNAPVLSVYKHTIPVTLVYVVPGLVVSVVVGTGLASYAATDKETLLHRAVSALSAFGLSAPSFVLAWVFYAYMAYELDWVRVYTDSLGLLAPQNLFRLMVPASIIALTFIGVQARHAQSETTEHLELEFVKTAKAKGAGRLRITRHVLRNAWPSMASLVQAEALGLLVLAVIVIEYTMRIPGVGRVLYRSFAAGDPMMSFTAVFFLVSLGVASTLARDFARIALDPQYRQ